MVRDKSIKNQRIMEVLQQAHSRVPPNGWDLFQAFVREFYHNVASYDFIEESLSLRVETALEAWRFFQARPPEAPKIRVYNQRLQENRAVFQRTVVELINDDMPFLVDSVSGVLNKCGLSLNLLIHPVLRVARDKAGHLLSLCRSQDQTCAGVFESFMRCETNEASSPDRLLMIENEILSVLGNVRLAVSDWPFMRQKVQEALSTLSFSPLKEKDPVEFEEIKAFLTWFEDHHFTFLGYCFYDFAQETETADSATSLSGLGILRTKRLAKSQTLFEGIPQRSDNLPFLREPTPLVMAKTTQKSPVHRMDFMDCIGVKKFNAEGRVVGLHQFLGLFTSSAYNQSARRIPLLRHKIQQALEKMGFGPERHDGKTLIHILETLPREELLQSSIDELCELSFSVLQLQERQRLSLFVRHDQFGRYVSCFVYVPRDRYDTDLRIKMGNFLKNTFQGVLGKWNVYLGDLAFARVHYMITKTEQAALPLYDVGSLEKQLFQISLTWRDLLKKELESHCGEEQASHFFSRYADAFTRSYQDHFGAQEALEDIREIEESLRLGKITIRVGNNLQPRSNPQQIEGKQSFQIKLYNPHHMIFLSDILPVFEQMGLQVRTEIPFRISPKGQMNSFWMHSFHVLPQGALTFKTESLWERFIEAFLKVWSKEMDNDGFNQLVLQAGLDSRECNVFRAYAKYLKQLQVPFSKSYMAYVLAQYPALVQGMMDLFHIQFSPESQGDREKKRESQLITLESLLEKVSKSDEDRILRIFLNLMTSTLRTNFYQRTSSGEPKSYLSLKFDCQSLDDLVAPRPLYEVFVCSCQVEGIHLRGGKVARGGIRWSDRREDYRTEAKDLWKTQTVKNAVIVPVGSKGAFIVKKIDFATQEELLEEGASCYKTFIRGLLDITDNWVCDKIVSPPRVVCRDGDDPYLVVAADKGTATFSDHANAIAQEYGFWLGDAFASGGSSGYDHKKMGITARGAWKSIDHHFRHMGVDVSKDQITVVGVGDMSGDVFGNGMLLSRTLKLVGAFNHQHIFIDPCPDPLKSYGERRRLFDLPRSTWMDYNPEVLSPGGRIFERSAKRVLLSPEIKELLSLSAQSLSPSELIQCLLKAPVDLLWFGGVGTFVKAQSESHTDVGDRANDPVRVDGHELQARVIGEGANLGLTQRGRIEYALKGGHLNTDALDNSAGVDCSDHEVNIKILFQPLLQKKVITLEARNRLLEQMTEDVAGLVLRDNNWQNKAVSLAYGHAPFLLEEHGNLMKDLEAIGKLNRSLEVLPDEAELSRRKSLHMGLTRPELCVLLAYGKIHLYQELLLSTIPDDPALETFLLRYFPALLSDQFKGAILNHTLRRDIMATCVTNLIVDMLGPSLVNEISKITGHALPHVARAILVVRRVLSLDGLEDEIDHLAISSNATQQLRWELNRAVKALVIWFLRHEDMEKSCGEITTRYQPGFDLLCTHLYPILPEPYRQKLEEKVIPFLSEGAPEPLIRKMMLLEPLSFGGDMIQISMETAGSMEDIAVLYYQVGECFGLRWAWEMAYTFPADTHGSRSAFRAIREEILTIQRSLTRKVILSAKDQSRPCLATWREIHQGALHIYDRVLQEVMSSSSLDLSSFVILNQELRHLDNQTNT